MFLFISIYMTILVTLANGSLQPPEWNLQKVLHFVPEIHTIIRKIDSVHLYYADAGSSKQSTTGSDLEAADSIKATEGYSLNRKRRHALIHIGTAIMRGMMAIRKLQLGGELVAENSKGVRAFMKPGGYSQAEKDFYSLNPSILENSVVYKKGRVGDRIITMRKGGDGQPPSIAVFKDAFRKKPTVDKLDVILYDD